MAQYPGTWVFDFTDGAQHRCTKRDAFATRVRDGKGRVILRILLPVGPGQTVQRDNVVALHDVRFVNNPGEYSRISVAALRRRGYRHEYFDGGNKVRIKNGGVLCYGVKSQDLFGRDRPGYRLVLAN